MRPLFAAFWILDPIYGAMGWLLAFFYSVIASYGLAIALLTVTVRIFLIPLTTKQVKSQQAMQRIQPELKRLQAKYKNDRVKLNEEMMKFYKENKVNPLAGCLPILLQAPIFIVLYRLILDLSHKDGPKHVPTDSNLFTSLVESGGEMVSWGIDLAEAATSVSGIGNALPYYFLIAVTVGTGYLQQKQMTNRLPKDAINPQMQMIQKVFPAIIGVVSLSVPAGVVIYFIVSNIWQIGQQAIMFKAFPPPHVTDAAAKADKDGSKSGRATPPRAKSGGGGGGANGSRGGGGSKPSSPKGGTGGGARKPAGKNQNKGKRPAPSPRPKGLPGPDKKPGGGPNGKSGPNGTSAKNSRRKDS